MAVIDEAVKGRVVQSAKKELTFGDDVKNKKHSQDAPNIGINQKLASNNSIDKNSESDQAEPVSPEESKLGQYNHYES